MPFAAGEASLPEPNVAVVPNGDYDDAHPDRALLIIEVADASLRKDRRVKADVYARAGVPEYWIVNLDDRVVEVHSDHTSSGQYGRVVSVRPGGSIQLQAFPDVAVSVLEILR